MKNVIKKITFSP